jgi:four helix bundle protein
MEMEQLGEAVAESAAPKRDPIRSYADLEVFKRSFALLGPVHDLVKAFPSYEQFDLAQQMRRASKSVPTNFAEGYSRRQSAKDFRLFLTHAIGSASEMRVHLKIALELGYSAPTEVEHLQSEYDIIGRQLNRLIQTRH